MKALETAREARGGQDIGFGFSLSDEVTPQGSNSGGQSTIGSIPTMLRTLGFVESREEDGIARGHLPIFDRELGSLDGEVVDVGYWCP